MLVNSPLTVRLPRHHHRFCLVWTIILQPFGFLGVLVVDVGDFSSIFFFSEADALILLFPASALHFAVCLKCIFSETF